MVDIVTLPLVFAAGIIAGGSPCALPLVPGFVAYLSSQGENLRDHERSLVGLLIILGVMSSMLAFAAVAAIVKTALGSLLRLASPMIAALLLFFGILLITNHNPFYRLPTLKIPHVNNSLVGAYTYGGLFGVIALPCSATIIIPITLAISISSTAVGTLGVFLIFLVFGLGLGLPVIVVSTISQAAGDRLSRWFAEHSRLLNIVSGLILIGVAIYDQIILRPFLNI